LDKEINIGCDGTDAVLSLGAIYLTDVQA